MTMDVVQHPGRGSDVDMAISRAKENAENKILRETIERLQFSLAAIFDGIKAGEQVPLHYPDGTVLLATKAKPRNKG